jgi:hypothetical protein
VARILEAEDPGQEVVETSAVAAEIAIAVGLEAQRAGVAPEIGEAELRQCVATTQWMPAYRPKGGMTVPQ